MIYDAFGKLIAEYGVKTQGTGGIKYVQSDWQGSVRTVTNDNGFVVARNDYQAFGGEIGFGVGARTIEQGYSVDKATKQGYGLTEEDKATGQQHTWFRKLETEAGRWTRPDPYNGSMRIGNPQSFNRYSYVTNDPINYVDPSGLDGDPIEDVDGEINVWTYTWNNHATMAWGNWEAQNIINWETPNTERSPGGGGETPQEKNDEDFCDTFSNKVAKQIEDNINLPWARVEVGRILAWWSLKYLTTLDKTTDVDYWGFKRSLTANGQGSDVLRHITGSAASVLLEGGFASRFDDERNNGQANDSTETAQRQLEAVASISGNQSGRLVADAILNRIRKKLTKDQLKDKIKAILCNQL